ncbi:MAG: sigma-70 family RNA polymerase sigma factor [Terracidiphilus sp.]|jgi:RNA polymerase sigma factor (sigma-70 family)
MDGEDNEKDVLLAGPAASEEARLALAMGRGDPEAEREFAVRYLPRIRAMMRARLRNSDVAADLVQDVMMESICALRRGRLREPAKLTAFVLAIARNVLYSHFSEAKRLPESLEFPDDLPDLRLASEDVEVEQRRVLAMHAIAQLDPSDKIILRLTLVEGLKPGTIAKQLGLSSDVVRQRKVRATRRVAEFVADRSQNEILPDYTTGKVL